MKALRIGICVMVAFAVLAFGAVEVWSESVLEIGAAGLLLWWVVAVIRDREQPIRFPPVLWPIAAFLGIEGLQLALGGSSYPFLTRVALMKMLACVTIFFVSIQVFRTRHDLKLLAWFFMCFGFSIAVFGIAQNYTSHNVIYWLRPLAQGGTPFGPYVDRDHFAGFMELVVPVGLCMLTFHGVRREQQMLVGVLTLIPIVALILTASRGGIVSLVCEMALIALIARSRRRKFGVMAGFVVLILAVGLVGWLGAGKILGRLKSSNLKEISTDRRVSMLRGAWDIFRNHLLAGTGLGKLVAVYPKYETDYDGRVVDHVHNDYAELLAETGVIGGLCGLAFLGIFLYTAMLRLAADQGSFSQAIHTAGFVACLGLLIHGFVDFNFHIPANGLAFLMQLSAVVSPVFARREAFGGTKPMYETSTIDFHRVPRT